ncbi:MAG: peptide chain release factor N(5)-glutamine methyltransferase [Dehalococcoidia bacterium]
MTLAEVLHAAQRRLRAAGIDDAGLEAEVLLRHALGLDRSRLFASPQDEIDDQRRREFDALVARRLAREPAAYVTGHKEFYGLDLETTPDALIPRPETELLVDEALRLAPADEPFVIADVGTGCGAIAIALAARLPKAVIYAIDASPAALALAERNAGRLLPAGRIRFLSGDLLDPLPEPAGLIVANLPYVKTSDWQALPPEIRDHEPRSALDAGPTGTEVIERLLREAPRHLKGNGVLLVEIGWDQGDRMREIAGRLLPGARVEIKKDLAALDRLLVIQAR